MSGQAKYATFDQYPMYKYLQHLQECGLKPKPNGEQPHERRDYENLTDADRTNMKVDEIFAFYLYTISQKVKDDYYEETMLPYVILFRECLDEIGWSKKQESEQQNGSPDQPGAARETDGDKKEDFCLENNAEHAPEICNEFVTVYLETRKTQINIPKPDQIDLTINLCHWLFEKHFTCSKLTMIS